jgi:hypothetical protein
MSRIQLTDSMLDTVVKMCEGNPGALTVLMECFKRGAEIDSDSALGGLGSVLGLDTLGIYGPRIWMFYKDVCKQDIRVMLAVLRANQLGFLSDAELNDAIDHDPWRKSEHNLDLADLVAKVEEELPNFQRVPVVAKG